MTHEVHEGAKYSLTEGPEQQCIQVFAVTPKQVNLALATRTATSAFGHGSYWEPLSDFQERIRAYTCVEVWPDPPVRLR